MKINLKLLFLILLLFQATLVYSCENNEETCPFDSNDPDTWMQNGNYGDEFYTSIDINDVRIDLSNPNIDINKFSSKLGELSSDKLNQVLNKISVENLQHLKASQISNLDILGKIPSLENLNKEEFNLIAKNILNADLTLSGTNIKFDSTTGMVSGTFGSYKPSDFPKDKFQQIVEGDKVKIIPINSKGEIQSNKMVTISGANNIILDGNGIRFEVSSSKELKVTGIQEGTIILSDGKILTFSNIGLNGKFTIDKNGNFYGENSKVEIKNSEKTLIKLEGKFEKKDNMYNLFSYSGKQSIFEDFVYNIKIQTTGYPILISNNEKYVDKNKNYVVYTQSGDIKAHGQISIIKNDLKVNSKDKDFSFSLNSGKITSTGIGEIQNNNFKYTGLNKKTQFTWNLNGKTEEVKIQGGEKNKDLAKFEKKMEVGYVKGWLTKLETPLVFSIKNINGEIVVNKNQYEAGLKKIVAINNGVVSPEFWITKNNNNLNLNLGDKININFNIADASSFKSNDKSEIKYVAPEVILNVFGEKKDTKGNFLIQSVLSNAANIKKDLSFSSDKSLGDNTLIGVQKALVMFYDFKEGNYFLFEDKLEGGELNKKTKISIMAVDNRYILEQVMKNPVSGAELTEGISPTEKNSENIFVATGHHIGTDNFIYGVGSSKFEYKNIPAGTNTVLFSACETIPPYDNLKIDYNSKQKTHVDNFLNQFPKETTLIGGYMGMDENGNTGVKAPGYDDNIPYALSEEMLKLKEQDPEKYIKKMILTSKDNSVRGNGVGNALLGVLSGIKIRIGDFQVQKQYQMNFYYKKSDGWYYYDNQNVNGVKVK